MSDPVTFDEEARPHWAAAEEKVLGVLRYAAGPVPFSGLDALLRRDANAPAARDALWRLVGRGWIRLTPLWRLEAAAEEPLDDADEMRRRLLLVAAKLVCREETGRSWEEAVLYVPNIEPSVKERHWCLEEAIKRLETEEELDLPRGQGGWAP